MKQPKVPLNESERLQSLLSYSILDSLSEESFDDLTKIASLICSTPISLISLIDEKRQWFKSKQGLNVNETARELAFCAHAINTPNDLFIVPNALEDDRFADNPLVTGDPKVIFYAGAPLVTTSGHALGTICVIDNKPNSLSIEQQNALKALSHQVVALLELKKKNREILQHQAEVEKQVDYFKTIFQQASVGVVLRNDENDTFIKVNQKICQMLGYTSEELLSKSLADITHPDDLRETLTLIENPNIKPRTKTITKRYVKKTGESISAESSISIFPKLGVQLAIIKDITQEKIAKDKLLQLTKELEIRNKDLEEFVYITSHDLQEPLRNINSIIGIIKEDHTPNINEELKSLLDYIQSSSERMQELIHSLLVHSRIGKNEKFIAINTNTLIKVVLSDLALSISEEQADIKIEPMPIVYGIEVALRQLFQNLISNAIKYKKENQHPVIRISCIEKEHFYEFQVSDNGIGIHLEYIEKVFVMFQRLHSIDQYEGLGIGLANCKKIVALHNGAIWVESDGSSGSTFYFTLQKTPHEPYQEIK